MKRRSFLAFLGSLPFVGRVIPEPRTAGSTLAWSVLAGEGSVGTSPATKYYVVNSCDGMNGLTISVPAADGEMTYPKIESLPPGDRRPGSAVRAWGGN